MYIFVQISPMRSTVNRKVIAQRIGSHCPVKYNLMLNFFFYLFSAIACDWKFFLVLNYGMEDLFDSMSVQRTATMGQTMLCLTSVMGLRPRL